MSKKSTMPEISVKSTKEQILTAYNEVLAKLNDKQLATPPSRTEKTARETRVSK